MQNILRQNGQFHKIFVILHKNKKFLCNEKAFKIRLLEHFSQKHKNIY